LVGVAHVQKLPAKGAGAIAEAPAGRKITAARARSTTAEEGANARRVRESI